MAIVLDPTTGATYEGVINLGVNLLEGWEQLPVDVDTMFAADEMTAISEMLLEDPRVLERLAVYGEFYSNRSNVVTDIW